MKEVEVINSIEIPNNILEPFKVYVRIRPFLSKEILRIKRNNSTSLLTIGSNQKNIICPDSIFSVNKKTLYVNNKKQHKKEKKYIFDNIFTEKNNNKDVFDIAIKPIINNVINGYNSTALAYGVTGTGKTHTIFGNLSLQKGEEGIAIKACDYLFKRLSSKYFEDDYIIRASYIEIYNENVIDLLNNEVSSPATLMIIEDPNKGVYCPNVKEYVISNSLELKRIICQGNKKRTMAPTNQNKFSSRSHAILQISLERKTFNEEKNNFDIFFSKFLVVDLAGSERGGLQKGKRREEGAKINKSLFTLGSCINILSDKNKNGKFIPYRDSKLTRILKDSLGGNILTVMLVCVSPSVDSYEESISSLNYATRAKKIKKKIYQNKKEIDFLDGNHNIILKLENNNNNNQYEEIIDNLKNEIYQLKNIIKEQENKLRNKNVTNETLNLEDDTILKDKPPNTTKKLFFEEGSFVSSIQMNNSQLNQKINTNNKNKDNINNTNIIINTSMIQTINEIDLDKYNKFFEGIKNKDFDISHLQKLIEDIKSDKDNLELYLEQNHILYNNEKIDNAIKNKEEENTYDNPEKKYILIKNYYDKFLEVINDKLIENIEQNMVLKCNIKEISELNKNNIDNLEILNQKLEKYKNKEEQDDEYDNINEQIKNIKNNIKENFMLKNDILKKFNENMNKKKTLKQILLSLLGDKKENSNKLINILKDKEKLVEMNKEFKKKIDTYLKIQKKKDDDINIVQRQVEILRAQLKEKEKKIFELKNQNNINNNNNYNYNNNRNNSKSNNKRNNNNYLNLYSIKRSELSNFINKGKRSTSCIRNNNLNNYIYNNKLRKNEMKRDDKKHKTHNSCYDISKESNSISHNFRNKISSKRILNKRIGSTNNKKASIHIYKSKSEVMRKENDLCNNKINTINDINNNLFKKIMFNQNTDDDNFRENTINIVEDRSGLFNFNFNLKEETLNENNINLNNIVNKKKNSNESKKKVNNNKYNKLWIKSNMKNSINNFIIKKDMSKFAFDSTRNNKRSVNLSQKRFEKFMNNRFYNHSLNNIKQKSNNHLINISKKLNSKPTFKKISLNEARYEKKLRNEKSEKHRDLSAELNHANAEYFINSFKGMNVKGKNESIENINSNQYRNNNIYTQESQNINYMNLNKITEKNKLSNIDNQNLTIYMDGNCQIETKENDSTNIKTDQSKILRTDDIYQDLVNSLRNGPYNRFKHK